MIPPSSSADGSKDASGAAGVWAAADRWFSPGRTALFLAACLLAVYPEVFLGFESFYYRDFGLFGYPLASYHRACFWRGELPLWNPYSNCGIPYLAQWNTMVLYPCSILYLVFPLPWSLNLFCLGHLILAGAGMHALARRWTGRTLAGSVAGLGFALNGLALNCLMWPNNMAALAWMPVVILWAERAWLEGGRRLLAVAALAGAMQMLAGAPEIVLFTWLILGLLCLATPGKGRALARRSLRLAGAGLLVLGLASAQLFPFLDLLVHSQRDAAFGGGQWSMPGWGWANLVVPLFRCSQSLAGVYSQDDQQWTSSYYPGVGMLLLAFGGLAWRRSRSGAAAKIRAQEQGLGGSSSESLSAPSSAPSSTLSNPSSNASHHSPHWRPWLLVALALGCVLLAMGSHGGLLPLLKKVLPPLGLIRFPIKFMVVALFAIPLLAAYGMAAWQNAASAQAWPAQLWRHWVCVGGVLTLLIGGLLFTAWREPFHGEVWKATWNSGASRVVFLAAILGVILWSRRLAAPWTRAACPWALLVLLALDVLTHAPHQNPTVRARALEPGVLEAEPGLRPGHGRAMISPYFRTVLGTSGSRDAFQTTVGQRQSRFPNWNLVDGVALADGFFSLYLKPQREIWLALYGSLERYPTALADFLGVSAITSDQEWFVWLRRDSAKPWITAGQRPVVAPDAAVLEAIQRPDFDPGAVVYLSTQDQPGPPVAKAARARVLSHAQTAHRIEAEIEADEPAMVTIAQTFHPAWKASVDGQPVSLWRANHAFQALAVPAGRHRVELAYRDRAFASGVAVSGASGLVWLALLARRPARRKVAGSEAALTDERAAGSGGMATGGAGRRMWARLRAALKQRGRAAPGGAGVVVESAAGQAGEWMTAGRFACVLGALILALYPGVVFGNSTFYYRDFGIFGYPLASFHRESFWRGEIPLWNPLNNCGLPFLAQWNTMTLYPGSLLYLLAPLSWALGVFCLAHMFWAGLGMFVLVRGWTGRGWTGRGWAGAVAGVAFAFNGLTWHALMWPNNIAALGWMPWVVWLAQSAWRRGGTRLLWAALGGSMQMLAGAPEIIFLTWTVVGVLFLVEVTRASSLQACVAPGNARVPRATSEASGLADAGSVWTCRLEACVTGLLRVGVMMALVSVLSAAQLLPFLDFLAHSQRQGGYDGAEWSMPGTGWANFILPSFHTFESFLGVQVQRGQYWTTSYYAGAGAVGLALWACWRVRHATVWALAALGLLGAVLALGPEGGLFPLLMERVPQLGFMRFPIKFVVLPVFVIPALAGWAVQAWLDAKPVGADAAAGRTLGAVMAGVALLIAGLVWFAWRYPMPRSDGSMALAQGIVRVLWMGALGLGLVALRRMRAPRWRGACGLGLLAVLWLDVRTHAFDLNPTVPRFVYASNLARSHLEFPNALKPGGTRAMAGPDSLAGMRSRALASPADDYLGRRLALFGDCNLLDGVPKVNGFFALYPAAIGRVLEAIDDEGKEATGPLLDFMGVGLVTPRGEVLRWTPRSHPMPAVSAGQRPVFASRDAALSALFNSNMNFRAEVLLPEHARASLVATRAASARVEHVATGNGWWAMDVEADGPALVVVSQSYFHPWRAYVDGKPARLYEANVAFQALEVPAGRSRVRLAYEDSMFKAGAGLSLLGWTGCLGGLAWNRRRRPPAPAAAAQ